MSLDCDYKPLANGHFRCEKCGDTRNRVLLRVCNSPMRHSKTCKHRGVEIGEPVVCVPCGGGVKIKRFVCGKFGECTIGKQIDGVKCCIGCSDKKEIA